MLLEKIPLLIIGVLSACYANAESTVENALQQEAAGWAQVPEILARIVPPTFPNNSVELSRFGGKGDGTTDNRPAFEKAILALAEQGGGKLVVTPGTYWIDGPIVMKSNIHI